MKKVNLYFIWVCLYVLCACLGLIPNPKGALHIFMTVLSILFFLPPLLLLLDAQRSEDKKTILFLRKLSIASLGLTVLLLIANIATFMASEVLGDLLYYTLVFVSVPMVCSGHYSLSLFLWAYLLFSTWKKKVN